MKKERKRYYSVTDIYREFFPNLFKEYVKKLKEKIKDDKPEIFTSKQDEQNNLTSL